MKIKIRTAGPEDASFLAWVMLTATRSHLKYGAWEHYVGGIEQECLTFLSYVATTKLTHLFHYSTFTVAEIDGQMAGAAVMIPKRQVCRYSPGPAGGFSEVRVDGEGSKDCF